MTQPVPGIHEQRIYLLKVIVLLLASLLMMRIIVHVDHIIPLDLSFRTYFAFAAIFVDILPVIIVFIAAVKMDVKTSFLLPFIVVALIYPVADALALNPLSAPLLLMTPGYYRLHFFSAIALGFIGLAGNRYPRNFALSMLLFAVGVGIKLVSTMNLVPAFWFVITGDFTMPMQEHMFL